MYIPYTHSDEQKMLEAIGVSSVEELFAHIPDADKLHRPLNLPEGMTEMEADADIHRLAAKNIGASKATCFLGAGCYDHFIPAVVDFVASRSEFLTSYTPYQAEVAQGNLQAIFEYQTMVCDLTGMDVSNAGMYDGGTAFTEAALLTAAGNPKAKTLVVAGTIHPEYMEILKTYTSGLDLTLDVVGSKDGAIDMDELKSKVVSGVAAVLVASPNFFGILEDVPAIAELAHAAGAALVVATEPTSLGLLKRPGDMGADVVTCDGQPLGNPMSYGGPHLGILAVREKYLRRMPGRLVGQTTDRNGNRCWVLTLQTREQHIRREKATSNICSNQALMTLRTTVYLSLLGPEGLKELSTQIASKADYAAKKLAAVDGLELRFPPQPFFQEFVVRVKDGDVQKRLSAALDKGIFAGVDLGRWFPELSDCFMVAVTEKRTKEEIDALAEALK